MATPQATPWALDELAMPDSFAPPLQSLTAERAHALTDYGSGHEYARDGEEQFALPEHTDSERVEQLVADAYARGVAEGEQSGRLSAEHTLSSALVALTAATTSVRLHEARWTANAEENIAALATVIARHLVQREVVADTSIVRELVQRALTHFPIDQAVSVRLHPDDLAACGASIVRDVRWIADVSILRGGCLVEGRERIIDGRVDTSLERAYRTVGQVQS